MVQFLMDSNLLASLVLPNEIVSADAIDEDPAVNATEKYFIKYEIFNLNSYSVFQAQNHCQTQLCYRNRCRHTLHFRFPFREKVGGKVATKASDS